jgi:phosphoribosylformimino-5-aminoimidazole carboxamide ribotide isomerase
VLTRKFTVYPAIDVLEGRVVRLAEGDPERVTAEGGEPVAAAERFAAEGASWLHVVDLDGALSSTPSLQLVERIARCVSIPVQVGGGYRSPTAVQDALDAGAARVLVGTSAVEPAFLEDAASRFGERLAVAVDVRDRRVVVAGWTQSSELAPDELARRCRAAGVRRLLVTSTRHDGSLAGPDLELIQAVQDAAELPVLAAGGIGSLDDVRALRELGCEGAIVGSALWRGRFTLADAVSLQR